MAFKNRKSAFTIVELMICIVIVMILVAVMGTFFKSQRSRHSARHSSPTAIMNCRQIALAGIMYGGDYDDMIGVTTNGWLSRMQDVTDKQRTVNCPAKGTQSAIATDAAGGARTDAWPLLYLPYIKSRGLYLSPDRPDVHQIWSYPALAATEPTYDPDKNTYRNQNLHPAFAFNYMFLSPLRIPASKRGLPNAAYYAVSEPLSFYVPDDPSNTVFFVESQDGIDDTTRGFYVANAPGMWDAFKKRNHGLIAYWTGGPGSGDWVGTNTASSVPGSVRQRSSAFTYVYPTRHVVTCFLDGHVKSMHDVDLAAGTDYQTAVGNADGGGAHIIDKSKYLWNATKDFRGL